MSLKAHKTPYKMRPIICCADTYANFLSKWIDYWLQKLKCFVLTYIKNSTSLLGQLDQLEDLSSNAKIFTADAVYVHQHRHRPRDRGHRCVEEGNGACDEKQYLRVGRLLFLQFLGTAMGTSVACIWATIYFSVHEIETLLPTYYRHLLIFKRFIDDMLGIWICDDATTWENIKADTNDFGILRWDFDKPSTSVVFLDHNLRIENNRIITSTYQKSINLYQYISPTSAHPPGMTKGIIFSLMKNYKRQNTRQCDYVKTAIKLFRRHVARGWEPLTKKRFILEANRKLRTTKPQPTL
ncbi:hypothetical protein ACHAWF_002366 [Thalassiosira exigua]